MLHCYPLITREVMLITVKDLKGLIVWTAVRLISDVSVLSSNFQTSLDVFISLQFNAALLINVI